MAGGAWSSPARGPGPTAGGAQGAADGLSGTDREILAALAYNRLSVQRYEEALVLYRFLSCGASQDARWSLGEGLCLVALERLGEARAALARGPAGGEAPGLAAARAALRRRAQTGAGLAAAGAART